MAFEIVWEDVLITAKEAVINAQLVAFTVPEQDAIIEEAECFVPETYGKLTKILRRYYAAHIAAQSLVEPAGEGANTNESIGSVSSGRNQAVNNPQADEGILETVYGRMYAEYIKDFKEHRIVAFGTFANNRLEGFKKDAPV